MIGRGGKLFLFLYVVFLVVLFLMCSTDLIIREPERESYEIAVIIEDVRGDNYSNFRKGMDRAAVEFNVDVHFITLYEKLDVKQQMELMDREQQDGADALIVVPAEEAQISAKQTNVPVILLRSGVTAGTGTGDIIKDYKKMGELLANELMQDIPERSLVLLLMDSARQSAMERLFLEGAGETLTAGGHRTRLVVEERENGMADTLTEVRREKDEKAVLLAENEDVLTETAGILANDAAVAEWVEGLYGRGNTMSILNYLDHGEITGICVTDDFSAGYLSVRAAVQILEGSDVPSVIMDSYYIEKDDLRRPECEKLLFPIE